MLSSAQKSIIDDINNDTTDNDEILNLEGDKYRSVDSHLAVNGDYQVNKRKYFALLIIRIYLVSFISK